MRKAGLGWIIALVVLAADQASKAVLVPMMEQAGVIEITGFFKLVMVWNRGVSFGLFNDHPETTAWLVLGGTSLLTLALAVWLQRTATLRPALALGLVIGGAVGNIVDRVLYGAVADFFSFHLGEHYWPAFNIADSAICVGVGLLLLDSFLTPSPASQPPSTLSVL